MFQINNATPFAVELTLLPDTDGVDTILTIVKGTFALDRGLAVADEQVPVAVVDEYFGAPDKSSIRAPSDVSLLKNATDVLVVGTAWAPGGRPLWQMDVVLAVGRLNKTLRVSGDRVWDKGSSMQWVTPFERMPLVWERAFGGCPETNKGPHAYRRNPVGVGFRPSGTVTAVEGQPLPNIEDPMALVTAPGDTPAPAGLAPIAPHWEPRSSYAGTYDQAWLDRTAPYLPADFDRRFFHTAPTDQVAPGVLQPGEWVQARGLSPSGDLRFQLPAALIETEYLLDDSAIPVAANLDTLLLMPDENRVVLVWRSALRCDKKLRKVNEVVVKTRSAAA